MNRYVPIRIFAAMISFIANRIFCMMSDTNSFVGICITPM
jgi:hypothetical protein